MTCNCKKVIETLEQKADRLDKLSEKYHEALVEIARRPGSAGKAARKALEGGDDEH